MIVIVLIVIRFTQISNPLRMIVENETLPQLFVRNRMYYAIFVMPDICGI